MTITLQARMKKRYTPPTHIESTPLAALLGERRALPKLSQVKFDFLAPASDGSPSVYSAGDVSLLQMPCVAVVGTRNVSEAGAARARRLARELVQAGVVVVSGLAKGVDSEAHRAAIEAGGHTIAVLGTPMDKVTPADNSELQELIYRRHLLLSPFHIGETVFKSNFPRRNRVMAAITDATVIIEASDTSGTLHQAAECQRLGRKLFIAKSTVDNPALTWPKRFINQPGVHVLESTQSILELICNEAG